MTFMTLDRLMAVVLGLKYPQYWTIRRTKKTLIVIWGIGLLLLILFEILYNFYGQWQEDEGMMNLWVSFSLLYIVVATVTYAVIFVEYYKSRYTAQRLNDAEQSESNPTSALQLFLKSRFYVSVLIILTYLLFNTIPLCVASFLKNIEINSQSQSIVLLLLYLGYTTDAVIYIFLQKDVRRQLFQLVCFRRSTRTGNDAPPHSIAVRDQMNLGRTLLTSTV